MWIEYWGQCTTPVPSLFQEEHSDFCWWDGRVLWDIAVENTNKWILSTAQNYFLVDNLHFLLKKNSGKLLKKFYIPIFMGANVPSELCELVYIVKWFPLVSPAQGVIKLKWGRWDCQCVINWLKCDTGAQSYLQSYTMQLTMYDKVRIPFGTVKARLIAMLYFLKDT